MPCLKSTRNDGSVVEETGPDGEGAPHPLPAHARASLSLSRSLPLLLFPCLLLLLQACSGNLGEGRIEGRGDDEPLVVRVLSYNIHHGEGVDSVFDLERLARVIMSVEPDLVALQEVDRSTTRSSGVDQVAELGRLTGLQAAFGKTMDFAGGGYGNAVLSRWPLLEIENHILPSGEGHEPRAALAVRVEIGESGREILFIGTHLDHTRDPADRMAQAGRINELLLPDAGLLMILAGDLNAIPESEPISVLLDAWTDAAVDDPEPTSPSDEPRRRIDYVLYRPAGLWRVVEVRVVEEKVASDHRPLLAVLELKDDR